MEPEILEILKILYTELRTELIGGLWIGCVAIAIPIVAYWRGQRWWIWQLIVLGSLGVGSLVAPVFLPVLVLLALLLALALPVLLVLLVLKPDALPRRWRREPLPLPRPLDEEGRKD